MPVPRFAVPVALAWVLLGAPAVAQEAAEPSRPRIEPRAERILLAADAFIQAADRLSFRARITYDQVLPTGQKLQFGGRLELAVKRPNKVFASYRGDLSVKKAWCNGKKITLYDQTANLFAVLNVPEKVDEAMEAAIKEAGFSIPLIDLVIADPDVPRLNNVTAGEYIGLHAVDGVACHHLAFAGTRVDWQIWIEDGPKLVPRKVVITYKLQTGAPQYTAWLTDWDFAPHLPDLLFEFRPPPGAEEIEFLKPEPKR